MTTYYKAVRVVNGQLLSAFITDPRAVIEYKIGEFVKPKLSNKHYGIFVSKDKFALQTVAVVKSADEQYLYDYTGDKYAIYECEVVLADELMEPEMYYNFGRLGTPRWAGDTEYKTDLTLLVKECKLVRQLTGDEIADMVGK